MLPTRDSFSFINSVFFAPIRACAASLGMILLAGCSTFAGQSQNTASADPSALETAQIQLASLQVEVSRLKSENARLANQLLDFQRERAREELAVEQQAEEESAQQTAEQQAAATPDPQPLSNAVVDSGDPALAQTDVPVENAPRLVQPSFASNETVFENEVDENAIETTSVLFGVHLASYRARDEARDGWSKLQRDNPDELGLLEPRVENVAVENKGVFLRLIGGGFSSEERASALCDVLKNKGQYCAVVGFAGQRLSLAEATP